MFTVLQRVSEFDVLHRTPALKNPLVASLPVGIVSLNKKAGFDLEIQTGFVGEVHAHGVIAKLSGELDSFNRFAFGLGKPQNLAGPLLVADRRFSFTNSHFRLSYRWIWLGLRSMSQASGAACGLTFSLSRCSFPALLLIPGLSSIGDLRQQGPDTLNVSLIPQANPDIANTLHRWNGDLLSLDMPIHAHQTEFEFLRCLCGGISLSHTDR